MDNVTKGGQRSVKIVVVSWICSNGKLQNIKSADTLSLSSTPNQENRYLYTIPQDITSSHNSIQKILMKSVFTFNVHLFVNQINVDEKLTFPR